jgi:hypothetical protein
VKASGKSGKFHGRRRAPVVEMPEEVEEEDVVDPRFDRDYWIRWLQMTSEIEHCAKEAERQSR